MFSPLDKHFTWFFSINWFHEKLKKTMIIFQTIFTWNCIDKWKQMHKIFRWQGSFLPRASKHAMVTHNHYKKLVKLAVKIFSSKILGSMKNKLRLPFLMAKVIQTNIWKKKKIRKEKKILFENNFFFGTYRKIKSFFLSSILSSCLKGENSKRWFTCNSWNSVIIPNVCVESDARVRTFLRRINFKWCIF